MFSAGGFSQQPSQKPQYPARPTNQQGPATPSKPGPGRPSVPMMQGQAQPRQDAYASSTPYGQASVPLTQYMQAGSPMPGQVQQRRASPMPAAPQGLYGVAAPPSENSETASGAGVLPYQQEAAARRARQLAAEAHRQQVERANLDTERYDALLRHAGDRKLAADELKFLERIIGERGIFQSFIGSRRQLGPTGIGLANFERLADGTLRQLANPRHPRADRVREMSPEERRAEGERTRALVDQAMAHQARQPAPPRPRRSSHVGPDYIGGHY